MDEQDILINMVWIAVRYGQMHPDCTMDDMDMSTARFEEWAKQAEVDWRAQPRVDFHDWIVNWTTAKVVAERMEK